jgi:hypothetical protein
MSDNVIPKTKPTDAVLDRAEDIYQAIKATNSKNFIKKYGKEAENVMRGAAMKRAKNQVIDMNQDRIKEIIKKKLTTNPQESSLEEGKMGKFLTGAALFAALMAGNKFITDSDPRMIKLKSAYEMAEKKGDQEQMNKIKDMITKQEVWLSTGEGTPQDMDEKLIGKQKKLDANKDGKISGEDFKMLRSMKEEVDYEGEMAKSELYNLIHNSEELYSMLENDTQLEAWIQSKITKAADYIDSVTQYIKYKKPHAQPQISEKTEYYLRK